MHFWDIIFRPLGGAAPSDFYTRYRLTKPWKRIPQLHGRGSPKKNLMVKIKKIGLKFSV